MSRNISPTVLPIQRAMAEANPLAWRDGLVLAALEGVVSVAFLDGTTARLRVVGPAVGLVAGEPVAYHPVAELLAAGASRTTARR